MVSFIDIQKTIDIYPNQNLVDAAEASLEIQEVVHGYRTGAGERDQEN